MDITLIRARVRAGDYYWRQHAIEQSIEFLRSKLTRYKKTFLRIYPKVVTPECFNRGSSQNFAWIPDRSIRE